MSIREFLIATVMLLAFMTQALADNVLEEVRKQEGLFVLMDFSQWAQMRFQFSDQQSGSSSNASYSQNSQLSELYNASLLGAIYNPHVFNFNLLGNVTFQQLWSSSSTGVSLDSKALLYQYNFNGTGFDRSQYPFSVHSVRQTNSVMNQFTPSYDYLTTSNGGEVAMLKDDLVTRLKYERNTQDITGGGLNSNTTSDTLSLASNYNFRDFSYTSLASSWTNSKSSGVNTAYSDSKIGIDFGNETKWGQTKNYTLSTKVKWTDELNTGVPEKTLTLSEVFVGGFGKALTMIATYVYSYDRTINFSGQDQLLTTNTAQALLRHRLYESLTTELSGATTASDLLDGTQDGYSMKVGLFYHKKLPGQFMLDTAASWQYQLTDQKLAGSDFSVHDEQHTVGQQGDYIVLGTAAGALAAVISVTSRNPNITYVAGTDYIVDLPNRRIQVATGGQIAPGTVLYISYTIHYDPSVKYSTVSRDVNATLSYLNGRYTLTGMYSDQTPHLISGQSQALAVNRTTLLRFQGSEWEHNYFAEYGTNELGNAVNWHVAGGWLYQHLFSEGASSLVINITDKYTVNSPVGLTAGYSENDVTGSTIYSSALASRLFLQLTGTVTDSRGGLMEGDVISLGANLRTFINKLSITLLGQSGWRIIGAKTNRSDLVRLEVTRYF